MLGVLKPGKDFIYWTGVFQAREGERKGYTRDAPLIALAPRVRAAFHSACVKNAEEKKGLFWTLGEILRKEIVVYDCSSEKFPVGAEFLSIRAVLD